MMVSHIALLTTWILTLVFLTALRFQTPFHYGVVAWASGWLLWTLAEYLLNRYLLHLPGSDNPLMDAIIQFHQQHHEDPDNIQYMFIHPLLIGSSVAPLMAGSWAALGGTGLLITSGFLTGYLAFIVLHTLQHHYTAPSIFLLKGLWQNHYLHHKLSEHAAYGVSTSLWDFLFRSLPPRHSFLTVDAANMKTVERSLRVVEVTDPLTEKMFLDVPASVYAEDASWVPPVKSEIENIFNPFANPYFTHGAANRWILVDQAGVVSGRIAAFVNFRKIMEPDNWVGGIGFFECAGDKSDAFLLFDAATNWLAEHFRVTAVEGPVNFGENDKYWGLLINGFGSPSYGMNYNHPVYQNFFEEYGFQIHYRQLTNSFDLGKPLPERFRRIADRVMSNDRYRFKKYRQQEASHFVQDFVTIYNQAWSSFSNFQPMEASTVQTSLEEMQLIMDEDFIWFAYAGDKPAGCLLAVPDANEILKHCGDISGLWGKLKFLFYKHRLKFSRVRVVLMGIVPEFQHRGLESALIMKAVEAGKKKGNYRHVELSWVGDFNTKMLAIHHAMGAVEEKQHATFRKAL